jgi:hypothetical protein
MVARDHDRLDQVAARHAGDDVVEEESDEGELLCAPEAGVDVRGAQQHVPALERDHPGDDVERDRDRERLRLADQPPERREQPLLGLLLELLGLRVVERDPFLRAVGPRLDHGLPEPAVRVPLRNVELERRAGALAAVAVEARRDRPDLERADQRRCAVAARPGDAVAPRDEELEHRAEQQDGDQDARDALPAGRPLLAALAFGHGTPFTFEAATCTSAISRA